MCTVHVVAAVFTDGGRVLACRRARHKEQGGLWEFPGGKVEPGESEPDALVREIHEELGVQVAVGGLVCRAATPLGKVLVDLACYAVTPAGAPPTSSTDHDELRWVEPAALAGLDWAPPDLPAVRMLGGGT